VTIPSGTTLAIRLVDELDSETAQAGQTFKATLDAPLSADGDVVIPAGHDVQGHVIDVKSAGKFAGKSLLALQLDRISVGTRSYNIQTDEYRREGSSRGKSTATKVGAGAAIGAIIGGIAGGGKGAAIGAAAMRPLNSGIGEPPSVTLSGAPSVTQARSADCDEPTNSSWSPCGRCTR